MRKVLQLMATLADKDVDWLATHGRVRHVSRDTTIIHQGQPFAALMVLLEGQLSVRLADQEIAVLYPGEVLGEISFVDARPPSASVVASQDSHVLVIDRDMLTAQLERDSGFAARFYRGLALFLASRLRATTSHLGYGQWSSGEEANAIEGSELEEISLAARRFDDMLRRLRAAGGPAA